MAREITLTPSKTYATKQNMESAIAKLTFLPERARYITCQTEDGRFYPIFMATGPDAGLICAVVHHGFCIAN